jgi:acetyl esterase
MFVVEEKGRVAGGALDPQIEHVLAVVAEASGEDNKLLAETAVADVRTAADPIEPFGIAPEEVAHVEDVAIVGSKGNDIVMRVYRPDGDGIKPVLVFFHGGCWVFCDLDTHDNLCRYLCHHADCVVVSVDYRLAPEHKFPAGVEDAYDVLKWLQRHAGEIGGDAARIAVGGDSAGGNIAAVVTMMARDRQDPAPVLQLLIYPITNIATMQTPSHEMYQSGYFLSREMMEWSADLYVTSATDRMHPYVSPLLATDLSSLAPAFVITAEMDILRDEGEAYAQRLAEAGNAVRAVRYEGMVHAFVAMAEYVDCGREALEECALMLREAFRK